MFQSKVILLKIVDYADKKEQCFDKERRIVSRMSYQNIKSKIKLTSRNLLFTFIFIYKESH